MTGPEHYAEAERLLALPNATAAVPLTALNGRWGYLLGRMAGRAIPARRDQPTARLHRQPVPATLTTIPGHSAHQGSSGNWTP